MTTISKKISQEEKINLIFSYLFSDEKGVEEEEFWNKLSSKKLQELEKINNEKVTDFSLLKTKVLGK